MNFKKPFLLIILFSYNTCKTSGIRQPLPFNKVVIWGHKLHSHSHSYIHYGYYKAFKHMGFDTYWFDDRDNVANFDFSSSLFLTEGQVDKKIPVRSDCFYVLHFCSYNKYQSLCKTGHAIAIQSYRTDYLTPDAKKVDDCIYYDIDGHTIFMPWATDLLPHEIDEIKSKVPSIKKENKIYHIGTVHGEHGPTLDPFKNACRESNIPFVAQGLYTSGKPISNEQQMELIQKSYMAPAIQIPSQLETGYIPCRIFKNISYGQMGITNSQSVYELFKHKIIYNADSHQLFYDAQERLKTVSLKDILELMDFVKTKHTYINRIEHLLNFFSFVYEAHLTNPEKNYTLETNKNFR